MERITKHGNKSYSRAFTLIELMVVLLIIALLASFVMPRVVGSIDRARESALKENLRVMRKAIDDYYTDTGFYPNSLDILVENKYIRHLPVDPIMDDSPDWELEYQSDKNVKGIVDLHSRSSERSSTGTPYNSW